MSVVLHPVWYQMVTQYASVTKRVTSTETVVPILKRQDAFQVQTHLVAQQHLLL